MKKLVMGYVILGMVVLGLVIFNVLLFSADISDWHDYKWFVEDEFDGSSQEIVKIELLNRVSENDAYVYYVEVTVVEEETEITLVLNKYLVALKFKDEPVEDLFVRMKLSFFNFFGENKQFYWGELKEVYITRVGE